MLNRVYSMDFAVLNFSSTKQLLPGALLQELAAAIRAAGKMLTVG